LWNEHVNALAEVDESGQHSVAAKTAEKELAAAINQARGAVIEVLKRLD